MSFDLLKTGWPNMAAVVCLALMPLVSLTLPAEPNRTHSLAAQREQVLVMSQPMIDSADSDSGQL